jgi:uncharacterized protein YegL
LADQLESVEFASNPDPRCPCVLLLDTSGSMSGSKIAGLNAGLKTLKEELIKDELAARRVELAIVTFGDGGVRLHQDFVTALSFEPPHLIAGGSTPMGEAVERSLDLVESRKEAYKANGIAYYRPWVFLISDGAPTDLWNNAANRVKAEEGANRLAFFAVGVEDADISILGQLSSLRSPVQLKGLAFRELFQWLSASQKQVSASQVGEQVALPPVNWGTV